MNYFPRPNKYSLWWTTCDEARKSKYDHRTKIFARHAHFLPKPFTRCTMFVNYFFFCYSEKNNVKNIKDKKITFVWRKKIKIQPDRICGWKTRGACRFAPCVNKHTRMFCHARWTIVDTYAMTVLLCGKKEQRNVFCVGNCVTKKTKSKK